MRLIDADKVVSEIQKMRFANPIRQTGHIYNEGLYDAINAIDNAETVDAVPVVRCKYCKHAHMTYDGCTKYCEFIADAYDGYAPLYLEPGSYCSYGKKKEEAK